MEKPKIMVYCKFREYVHHLCRNTNDRFKKKLNRVSSLILNSVDKFMSVYYTGLTSLLLIDCAEREREREIG